MTLTRGDARTTETTLVVETCCNCGVLFGLGKQHRDELVQNHGWFYCPNGHRQHYVGKTDAEKERERADRLERQLGSLAFLLGVGHETFPNVRDHIADQHPDFPPVDLEGTTP